MSNLNYSVNDSVLTGMIKFAFWQKCVKSGVPEDKVSLSIATQKADEVFSANYDSNEPLLQKQFVANCTISVVNGQISVAL